MAIAGGRKELGNYVVIRSVYSLVLFMLKSVSVDSGSSFT